MAEITYTCDVCSQEFSDIETIKTHMADSHTRKSIEVQPGEEKY